MKTLVRLTILIVLIGCAGPSEKESNQQVVDDLEQLIEDQDFFKLKDTFQDLKSKLSKTHVLYFSAIIDNVFNKAEESNKIIKELLTEKALSLNDTMLNKLYGTKLLNDINLYEYGEAAQTSEIILKNYKALNDSTEIEALQNEIKIWEALKDVGKQQIIKNKDTTIPMIKDKVGLFNIDVLFGDSTKNFLFDTGANFSVIIRSLVDKLGLSIIEADFYVTAATGVKVKSDIAIAERLSFGDITFLNVVFLVLNDEDLSFPQIGYYPNGAIGFPVIEALDEIRISKENQIFVPHIPIEYAFNNFALDGLMPVVASEYKGDRLRFNFDTGATQTSLYPLFFKDYKQEIERNYQKETFKSGSGGGTVEFEGYIINDFQLKIADSETRLDSLRLHIENIGDKGSNFHGNFGQDYISQFDEMILSFKHSSVLFK